MTIQNVINEREKTHGDFRLNTITMQNIKSEMKGTKGWYLLSPEKKEALEMIAHKIGRILHGDPNCKDHWDDIAGYATLVSNQIEKNNTPFKFKVTYDNNQYIYGPLGARW